ncbi:hypothetical protein LTR17_001168 [Elasticomyces elasticus]|nr:hypothetical protein LTR17_001168 [Elasticomyces elasticus]
MRRSLHLYMIRSNPVADVCSSTHDVYGGSTADPVFERDLAMSISIKTPTPGPLPRNIESQGIMVWNQRFESLASGTPWFRSATSALHDMGSQDILVWERDRQFTIRTPRTSWLEHQNPPLRSFGSWDIVVLKAGRRSLAMLAGGSNAKAQA